MVSLKRPLLAVLTSRPVRAALAPLMQDRATVFMLHGFLDPETGRTGHDPAQLRRTLAMLRRERYELIGLDELFRRLDTGQPLRRAVAFTIDDGYASQVRVAGPVFAEFDCPVTIFVTTGFLDGLLWFWWDRLEYVVEHAPPGSVPVRIGGAALTVKLDASDARAGTLDDLVRHCKQLTAEDRDTFIANLASAAGVELPRNPPARYAPVPWDELRGWEHRGLTFGPHTVTHPILSHATAEQSRTEITSSWVRLTAEARRPLRVFCYPNGQPGDFGPRELDTLRDLSFSGAVIGTHGHPTGATYRAARDARFHIPRFAYPDDPRTLMQYASGVEHVKDAIRGRT